MFSFVRARERESVVLFMVSSLMITKKVGYLLWMFYSSSFSLVVGDAIYNFLLVCMGAKLHFFVVYKIEFF